MPPPGMLFDRACIFAETALNAKIRDHGDPNNRLALLACAELIAKSRLFVFKGEAIRMEDMTEAQRTWLNDNLYLPFPMVCIEDSRSAVFFADFPHDDDGVVQGIGVKRCVAEVSLLSEDDPRCKDVVVSFGTATARYGDPSKEAERHRIHIALAMDRCYAQRKGGSIAQIGEIGGEMTDQEKDNYNKLAELFAGSVAYGYRQLSTLDDPTTFIVESIPVSQLASQERGEEMVCRIKNDIRIKRHSERPQYTLLKPKAIRQQLGLPDHDDHGGVKKRPHERRAHERRLMSDRFVYKQGQTIKIPSCWIGPSQAIVGNRRYRVILD